MTYSIVNTAINNHTHTPGAVVAEALLAIEKVAQTLGRSKTKSAVIEAMASVDHLALSLQVIANKGWGKDGYNVAVAKAWQQDALTDLHNATLINTDSFLQQALLNAYVITANVQF